MEFDARWRHNGFIKCILIDSAAAPVPLFNTVWYKIKGFRLVQVSDHIEGTTVSIILNRICSLVNNAPWFGGPMTSRGLEIVEGNARWWNSMKMLQPLKLSYTLYNARWWKAVKVLELLRLSDTLDWNRDSQPPFNYIKCIAWEVQCTAVGGGGGLGWPFVFYKVSLQETGWSGEV